MYRTLLLLLLFIVGCDSEKVESPIIHVIDVLVVYDTPIDMMAIEADFQSMNYILINSYLEDYVTFNFILIPVTNRFEWPRDNINANEYLIHNAEVEALREVYGADVVIGINANPSFSGGTGKMFVDSNTVNGWTFYTYTELDKEAYAIVSIDELGGNDYVFAHELLHTFGLQHDLQTAYIDWNVSNAYPYAHAFQDITSCTIMARACQRNLILADKELNYNEDYSSNNRRRFIETAPIIAGFRQ